MALNEQSLTARSTADLPFGGLGVSLEACEEFAATLSVQVHTWSVEADFDGVRLHEPPVALSGYRLLTVLGREIRGR